MDRHDSATCSWCQGGEHFFAPTKLFPQAHIMAPAGTRWVMLTKRTEDPKLAWLETHLREHGIPSRRRGSSFHAPILEVPKDRSDEAWKLLDAKIGRRVLDDIPDDDPMFRDGHRHGDARAITAKGGGHVAYKGYDIFVSGNKLGRHHLGRHQVTVRDPDRGILARTVAATADEGLGLAKTFIDALPKRRKRAV